MIFFSKKENVNEYIKMVDGFNGSWLIEQLKKHLPPASKILEIGMGPGKDLDILLQDYKAAGSDNSRIFIDLYLKNHNNADLMLLDAVSLKTNRKFDALYSNKVLIHLIKSDLQKSIIRQSEILNNKGIIQHSFWNGTGTESFNGLFFQYYKKEELIKLFDPCFTLIECKEYTEMEDMDSIYITAEKK